MGDYSLSGLSSRSFEKLIQALAAKVLGPGTVTFGDGPDGGREATYEGKMSFPSAADGWDGYCVVQAKFLQRPQGAQSDGRWFIRQLETELKGFASRRKRRRTPEFMILATNVVLTAVNATGSKDRAERVFTKYQKKLRLRGWRIWDFDEISKFLDDASDIRRAYGAWITPGDVLHEIISQLTPARPQFLDIMTSFLARELIADQYANLEQAGHHTDDKIALARVFVDLPTTGDRCAEPPPEPSQQGAVIELVSAVVARAGDPLDPESVKTRLSSADSAYARSVPLPGRYVLVGGPGQGKTTIGQFVCQLFRAALLRTRRRTALSREVADTISAIEQQCSSDHADLPRARRFPVRVILSDLATALSSSPDLSLLAYLAQTIQRRVGRTVAADDLREWLGAYPWLLVLDGLDEVPASTNRDDVLRRVEEFWIDAAQVNADVLVLATTRPQGYNDEFSPAYYQHLWLAPLSPTRALQYARRLVQVRYAGDSDRQEKILSYLEKASRQDTTARLMRTPLQVTIMATLVDQIGPPPQDRWRLFHEYYQVIFRRERERPIPAAQLLRDHRADIDAIHMRVGLVLQVESEQTGGTDAKVTAEKFSEMVAGRLREEGHSGSELARLQEGIVDAAANRLVFLVGLQAGQVGFEIRSLQEFMAAEALLEGGDQQVQTRLRKFAPIANWRNVLLFAAGRCFGRDQQLRDTVYTICVELDQDADPIVRATRAGSILALDLLEDGVAHHQPKYARLLAQCAIRLLDLPPDHHHARLADICQGEVSGVVREALSRSLHGPELKSLAGWVVLLALVERGVSWALTLGNELWPTDAERRSAIVSLAPRQSGVARPWLMERIEGVLRDNPWPPSTHLRGMIRRRTRGRRSLYLWTADFWYNEKSVSSKILPVPGAAASFTSIEHAKSIASSLDPSIASAHRTWAAARADLDFAKEPSKAKLAQALKEIAGSVDSYPVGSYLPMLSWIVAACVCSARSREELLLLADRAESGGLGDLRDWKAGEERWASNGVTIRDFAETSDEVWPFDARIASVGFPFSDMRLSFEHPRAEQPIQVTRLLDALKVDSRAQRALADLIVTHISAFPSKRRLESMQPAELTRLISLSHGRGISYSAGVLIAQHAVASRDERWFDVLDEVTRWARFHSSWSGRTDGSVSVAALAAEHRGHHGLLTLLSAACQEDPQPSLASMPPFRFEDYREDSVQWAAIVVELARGQVTRARARELAERTARLGKSARVFEAVQVIGTSERPSEGTTWYLLELRARLGEDNAEVMSGLSKCLRQRSSGVSYPAIWRALDLPGEAPALVEGLRGRGAPRLPGA